MGDMSELMRDEAQYQATLIGTVKVLHHECIAEEIQPPASDPRSMLPSILRATITKHCPHGPQAAGTRMRTLIKRNVQSWLFEWTSDGTEPPRFLVEVTDIATIRQDGNRVRVNSTKQGEPQLNKLGLREGRKIEEEMKKRKECGSINFETWEQPEEEKEEYLFEDVGVRM